MIPQAFTTRDMSDAYKWLQTLPPSVREEMKSMEQVVSLYLRAKRLGGAVPTPDDLSKSAQQHQSKSSQDFQKTLKNLQHELEQFDFNEQTATPAAHGPVASSPVSPGYSGTAQSAPVTNASYASAPPHAHAHSAPQLPPAAPFAAPPTQATPTPSQVQPHPHVENPFAALRLDPKSRQIIHEIREGLNLSSDLEVIRLSLVVARRHLESLLK